MTKDEFFSGSRGDEGKGRAIESLLPKEHQGYELKSILGVEIGIQRIGQPSEILVEGSFGLGLDSRFTDFGTGGLGVEKPSKYEL